MLKLNKSTLIALHAVVTLGAAPEKVFSASAIAKRYRVSEHHVAKVLQRLVRANLVESIRGLNGGFKIARDPKKITMLEVVELFESASGRSSFRLTNNETSRQINAVLDEIRNQAYFTLKSISIATLIEPKRL